MQKELFMKNNFLLINPHKPTIDYFFNDENIFFIADNFFSYYDGESSSRHNINIQNYEVDHFKDFEIKNIVNSINQWHPVLARWVSSQGFYNHFTREASFFVYKLAILIEKFNIKKAVFNTGISHHIDTLLIQISCESRNLEIFFLYCAPIEARLIPMRQNKSIFDREALNLKVSDYNILPILEKFIIDTKNKTSLPYGIEKSKSGMSLSLSILSLFILVLKDRIKKLINLFTKDQDLEAFYIKFTKLRFFNEVNIMLTQRLALKYYKKNILKNDLVDKFFEDVSSKIIIAAHFQPEATSDPEGGDFTNHVDICLYLRKLGYKDDIYYKEHPASNIFYEKIVGPTKVGINRSISYYKQLHDLRVVFLNFSYSLSSHSNYLPVTITGTIAIERSLLGYHTIVVGEPWFKKMPGVIHISTIKDLSRINENWIKRSESVAKEALIFCNNHLGENTLHNAFGIGTGRVLGVTDTKKSIENYSNFIQKIDIL